MSYTRSELVAMVEHTKERVKEWTAMLAEFDARPENNVYDDLKKALSDIEGTLESRAVADCEGSHNCGQELYTQGFFVGHQEYIGTLRCEYSRHDKTYYYLDDSEFSYEGVTR